MRNSLYLSKQTGLTLIELVIAMAITAVVGIVSANMLRVMTDNSQQVEDHQRQINKLQRDLTLIQSDLDQIALRSSSADRSHSNIATSSESYVPGLILEFSRFVTLPNGFNPQVRLERVRYIQEENQLIRLSQPVDSPANDQLWTRQPLLDRLESIQVGLLYDSWQESLPRENKKPLRAVRLTISSLKWNELELISLTSSGGSK